MLEWSALPGGGSGGNDDVAGAAEEKADGSGGATPTIEQLASGGARFLVLLTLAEGETIRRILHTDTYATLTDAGTGTTAHSLSDGGGGGGGCGFALHSLHHDFATLDVSRGYAPPAAADSAESLALARGLQCMRFFNNEMYYTDGDLRLLMDALAVSPAADREGFFEECLRVRRRQRRIKADTPVMKLFIDDLDDLRPGAMVEAVKSELAQRRNWVLKRRAKLALLQRALGLGMSFPDKLLAQIEALGAAVEGAPSTLEEFFGRYDTAGKGALSRRDLMAALKDLCVAAPRCPPPPTTPPTPPPTPPTPPTPPPIRTRICIRIRICSPCFASFCPVLPCARSLPQPLAPSLPPSLPQPLAPSAAAWRARRPTSRSSCAWRSRRGGARRTGALCSGSSRCSSRCRRTRPRALTRTSHGCARTRAAATRTRASRRSAWRAASGRAPT